MLGGKVAGARAVGLELGPEDIGSSSRRKIAVAWNEAGVAAGLPAKLFCKSTFELSNRIVLGVSGGAFGENGVSSRHPPPLHHRGSGLSLCRLQCRDNQLDIDSA